MAGIAADDVKPMVDQMIELLSRRVDDPAERFSDEAAPLFRRMDWDSDLGRQPQEIRALAPEIQHTLDLLERSRGRGRAE